MDKIYAKKAEILKAMAHPIRLRLIKGLLGNECSVSEIVENLKIPQSTVSQHLGLLRKTGIILPKKDGVKTCYSVIDKEVIEILNILIK